MSAENITLVMWSKRELPERTRVDGEWKPTGRIEEKTEYTFRDEFGETIVLFGNNDYRELEGKECDIVIGITYNSFQRTNRVSLEACTLAN